MADNGCTYGYASLELDEIPRVDVLMNKRGPDAAAEDEMAELFRTYDLVQRMPRAMGCPYATSTGISDAPTRFPANRGAGGCSSSQ